MRSIILSRKVILKELKYKWSPKEKYFLDSQIVEVQANGVLCIIDISMVFMCV